jgi:hypothetical protein
MGFGERLGVAGIILAFFGIAAPILWPDKKWIGYASLLCAIGLLFAWGWVEFSAAKLDWRLVVGVVLLLAGFYLVISHWMHPVKARDDVPPPPATANLPDQSNAQPPSSSPPPPVHATEPEHHEKKQTPPLPKLVDDGVHRRPIPSISQHSEGDYSPNTVTIEPPKRTLAPARGKLLSLLGSHPEFVIHVEVQTGSQESLNYANELFGVLNDAGWSFDVDHVEVFTASVAPTSGVLILTQDTPSPAADHLYQSLRSVGIESNKKLVQGLRGEGIVVLQVGVNPDQD